MPRPVSAVAREPRRPGQHVAHLRPMCGGERADYVVIYDVRSADEGNNTLHAERTLYKVESIDEPNVQFEPTRTPNGFAQVAEGLAYLYVGDGALELKSS